MDLYTQSEAVGSVPVTFRIFGKELQLVTDNKLKFPSDNNHPEDVIGRFKIVSETDTTLTVKGMNSAPYLASQLGPVDDGSKTISYLDHWIRSFEFDPNGNYILQQTSLKMSDKTIIEFMESIYPRANLAPGKDFQKFEMDPEDPVGAQDGAVARYRFLPGDAIIQHDKTMEKKLAYAQHFDISPKADGTPGTIDWYVTPNIPDEYMAPVKEAVEGWNRYFTQMKGIDRPVMRFMGKLPDGIHIGDPRYNVINWDSRLIAGAAYESQVTDPETGKQSHSMIYMPAAWLQIGANYWQKGIGSDESAPADPIERPSHEFKFQRSIKCARDLRDGLNLMASGRLMDGEVKNFGIQLLKQTLFHEVGHALGFAHNFAGSLSYDPANPKSMFSTSIMDYNDFELERAAFYNVDSSDGPLLEYDRQMLSVIYNQGKDVAESDAVLPACNDNEADSEAGGVNPLCIRYDLQHDPSQSVSTAIARIENEKVDSRDISLSQALARIPDLTLPATRVQDAKTQDQVLTLAAQLASALRGSLDFYISSDVSALMRTVRTNIKSLLEYGIELPAGYDEAQMRERVFAGVQKAVAFKELPAAPKKALEDAIEKGMAKIAATPFIASMDEMTQLKVTLTLDQLVTAAVQKYMTDAAQGLPAARAKLLASLARHSAVDFYLGKSGDAVVDYEKNVVGLLADVVSAPDRSAIERVAAATALKSYSTRLAGENAIAAISSKLKEERVAAASNDQRRAVEAVLKVLGLN
jgi:hypothetical protein